MSQTLILPADIYRKLTRGAAQRGMTVESLLEVVSELVVLPEQPSAADRRRSARIEKLLERFQAGRLNADARAELDDLIDADYQAATARADRLIDAQRRRARNGRSHSNVRRRPASPGAVPSNRGGRGRSRRWSPP